MTGENGPERPRQILFLLWSFAFLSYALRVNIAVAQHSMARELSLSTIQVGEIFSAFLIGYTIFQIPAGLFGDRFGARLVLAISGLLWAATTFLTGFVPGVLFQTPAFALASLLVLRFIHGLAEAATYPVAMNAVSENFAPAHHALLTSLVFTGSTLGAAAGPPLVAYLMTAFGWRQSFYLLSLLPFVVALWWWRAARRRASVGQPPALAGDWQTWRRLLLTRNIAFLCLSYLLYCYAISIFVYWLFQYLVEVRHLSVIGSGWATGLPWIAASVAVPCFGLVSTRVSAHLGPLGGRRLVAMACLAVASLLIWFGIASASVAVTLTAISLSVALLFSTESSYWATAIDSAPRHPGASSGLMNLAGNLGGILSTSAVPLLAARFGWFLALTSGALFALLAALAWIFLRQEGHDSVAPGAS